MPHTPGPWVWDKESSAIYSAAELGKQHDARRAETYDYWATAIVETDGGQYGPRNGDINLIVTAPDMLALLEDIAAGDAFGSIWREQAEKLVAKATSTTELE